MIFLTSDDCILWLFPFICLALPSKPLPRVPPTPGVGGVGGAPGGGAGAAEAACSLLLSALLCFLYLPPLNAAAGSSSGPAGARSLCHTA